MSDKNEDSLVPFSFERLQGSCEALFKWRIKFKMVNVDLEKREGTVVLDRFLDGDVDTFEVRFGYNESVTEFRMVIGGGDDIPYSADYHEPSGKMVLAVGMYLA